MRSVNFNTYIPLSSIEKSSKEKSTPNYIVEGIASNSDRDLQGEVIEPSGLNIEYLLNSGYIDYEHDKDSVIGVPINDGTYVDDDGLHLKALIFGDDPRVQKMFELQSQFDKNHIDRSLGFSIEGKVLDRDSFDESIVREVLVSGVALTYRPACDSARVNTWSTVVKSVSENNTLEEVQKSLDSDTNKGAWVAGEGISPKTQHNGAAMRTESLEGAVTTIAEEIKRLNEMGVTGVKELKEKLAIELSKDSYDDITRKIFLQVFTGVSDKEAIKVLHESFTTSELEHKLSGSDESGFSGESDEED
ncbi:hypothetical protein [uncultured Megamonas sp.]|uniref:hypothetical protein n=1 Tax=uncultured Megamonas sp. TaxID=286140 RepID=UPI00259BF2A5|nr:hypothetical protein [uncultured Megamonas sp.]